MSIRFRQPPRWRVLSSTRGPGELAALREIPAMDLSGIWQNPTTRAHITGLDRRRTGAQPDLHIYNICLPVFFPQSQIVLVSPLMPDDPDVLLQIRARGYRVLVISPDPVSFEKSQLPDTPSVQMSTRILSVERHLLLQTLVRGGIRVVNWDVRQPFEQSVGRLNRNPLAVRSMEFGG